MGTTDANEHRRLEDLVHRNGELADLIRDPRHGESASPVAFRRGHAMAAAEKVTSGLASPDQLVIWAQAVHLRSIWTSRKDTRTC
ncbi:hypothetical protein [Streptomyces sp. NBC_01565]|uniref:hypothetical protein n=1 Tax=Streptomyces sp. NBC_01565 TaxID=2975881 RepID=UPI002256012D|nr:hypothetical protein [Streptomyces sp. NBC_01565]MCX4539105.1 hypothetical protein [Streptomyces sp. NBC_01565]